MSSSIFQLETMLTPFSTRMIHTYNLPCISPPRLPHHSNPPLHPQPPPLPLPLPPVKLPQIHTPLPHILKPTFPIQRITHFARIDVASESRGVGVRETPLDEFGAGAFAFVAGVRAEGLEDWGWGGG